MQESTPSASAETVTVVRAQLHRMGIVDDPYAERMLSARSRLILRAFEVPLLGRYPRNATFSFLAARTHFFEVDHPGTQAEKRQRAPSDPGPVFVACDLMVDDLHAVLRAGGFRSVETAVFIVEGLTMYLPEADVRALFTALAGLSAPGSRLAVNFRFDGGGSYSPLARVVTWAKRAQWARGGEPTHQWVRPDALDGFMAQCGWTVSEAITGPELAARYLTHTVLPTTGVSPGAICVSGTRTFSGTGSAMKFSPPW